MVKGKITVTVDEELDEWIDDNWKKQHYQSKSHMVTDAVTLLKGMIEGKAEHPLLKEFVKYHAAKRQESGAASKPTEKMHCPYGDFDVLLMTNTVPPLVQCDYVDTIGKCSHPGNNGKKCTYKKEFK